MFCLHVIATKYRKKYWHEWPSTHVIKKKSVRSGKAESIRRVSRFVYPSLLLYSAATKLKLLTMDESFNFDMHHVKRFIASTNFHNGRHKSSICRLGLITRKFVARVVVSINWRDPPSRIHPAPICPEVIEELFAPAMRTDAPSRYFLGDLFPAPGGNFASHFPYLRLPVSGHDLRCRPRGRSPDLVSPKLCDAFYRRIRCLISPQVSLGSHP